MVCCHHPGIKIPKKPNDNQKIIQNKGRVTGWGDTFPLTLGKRDILFPRQDPQPSDTVTKSLQSPVLLPGQCDRAASLCLISGAHTPLHWHMKGHRGYEVSKDTNQLLVWVLNTLCLVPSIHLSLNFIRLMKFSLQLIRQNALAVNNKGDSPKAAAELLSHRGSWHRLN